MLKFNGSDLDMQEYLKILNCMELLGIEIEFNDIEGTCLKLIEIAGFA